MRTWIVVCALLVGCGTEYIQADRIPVASTDAAASGDVVTVDAAPGVPDSGTDTGADVSEVACTGQEFAEVTYAGKSVDELSGVRVLGHLTVDAGPPGYEWHTALAYVRDGAVAGVCGPYDRLRFVR